MIAKLSGSKGYLIDGYPREVAQVDISLWQDNIQLNFCELKTLSGVAASMCY